MNVSSIGAPVSSPQAVAPGREAAEAPGVPDRDGDADDRGQAPIAKAPLPSGVGTSIDKIA